MLTFFVLFTGNWDIELVTQPARSPDLNHLDLSFFRALERNNSKKAFPSTIDELIANVEELYRQFDPRTIEKGFVTLACVCNEIIRCGGDNTYDRPHIGKEALLNRDGALPLELPASIEVLEVARKRMNQDEMEDPEDQQVETPV